MEREQNMPRPKKCRKICALPENIGFCPVDGNEEGAVSITVDEYETIRLIDYLGYNQESCAAQMGVARTTVQAVYNEARKKIATALVEGKSLNVEGGDYIVCPQGEACSVRQGCQHESCSYCKKRG